MAANLTPKIVPGIVSGGQYSNITPSICGKYIFASVDTVVFHIFVKSGRVSSKVSVPGKVLAIIPDASDSLNLFVVLTSGQVAKVRLGAYGQAQIVADVHAPVSQARISPDGAIFAVTAAGVMKLTVGETPGEAWSVCVALEMKNIAGFAVDCDWLVVFAGRTVSVVSRSPGESEPAKFTLKKRVNSVAVGEGVLVACDESGCLTRWQIGSGGSLPSAVSGSRLHWHSRAAQILVTREAVISGGHEGVLVRWAAGSDRPQFFPRVGGRIVEISGQVRAVGGNVTAGGADQVHVVLNTNAVVGIDICRMEFVGKAAGVICQGLPMELRRMGSGMGGLAAVTTETHGWIWDVEKSCVVSSVEVLKRNFQSTDKKHIWRVSAFTQAGERWKAAAVERRGWRPRLFLIDGEDSKTRSLITDVHDNGAVTKIEALGSDAFITAAGTDGCLKLWKRNETTASWGLLRTFKFRNAPVHDFTVIGHTALVTACGGHVVVFDIATGDIVKAVWAAETGEIRELAVGQNDVTKVACVCTSRGGVIVDLVTGEIATPPLAGDSLAVCAHQDEFFWGVGPDVVSCSSSSGTRTSEGARLCVGESQQVRKILVSSKGQLTALRGDGALVSEAAGVQAAPEEEDQQMDLMEEDQVNQVSKIVVKANTKTGLGNKKSWSVVQLRRMAEGVCKSATMETDSLDLCTRLLESLVA